MTCPYYNGNRATDGRYIIYCGAVPRGKTGYLFLSVMDETIRTCCLGNYPECVTYQKYHDQEEEK